IRVATVTGVQTCALPIYVFHGQQNHERGSGQKERGEKDKERIDHHGVMESEKITPCHDCSAELQDREGAENSSRQRKPGIPVFIDRKSVVKAKAVEHCGK